MGSSLVSLRDSHVPELAVPSSSNCAKSDTLLAYWIPLSFSHRPGYRYHRDIYLFPNSVVDSDCYFKSAPWYNRSAPCYFQSPPCYNRWGRWHPDNSHSATTTSPRIPSSTSGPSQSYGAMSDQLSRPEMRRLRWSARLLPRAPVFTVSL